MRPIINTFSSGAQHVSDLVWADIDKELNLPYSYSGKN